MALFDQLSQHLLEYEVLICKRCQYAINPAQVYGHVQSQHLFITKGERQSIVQIVAALPNLAKTPENVRCPDRGKAPIEGLPVFQNGLRCIFRTSAGVCGYVCRGLTGMQRHCHSQHQWKNPRRRGGYPKHRHSEETGQI